MPEFPGNDKELEALAAYIVEMGNEERALQGVQSEGLPAFGGDIGDSHRTNWCSLGTSADGPAAVDAESCRACHPGGGGRQ